MADIYGVKVKLHFETSEANLRKQLQDMLNKAVAGNPLTINKFQIQKNALTSAINEALGKKAPLMRLTNIKLGLEPHTVAELQQKLNDKNLELTIKNIKADQAVTNLRNQLVKMLGGLQISGVKEFLAGADFKEQAAAAESYAGNLQRLKGMLSALNKANNYLSTTTDPAAVQEMISLYTALNQQVNLAIQAGGQWENIDGLQTQIMQLNSMIEAYKQLQIEQKKAAAEEAKKKPNPNDAVMLVQLRTLQTRTTQMWNRGIGAAQDIDAIEELNTLYTSLTERIQIALSSEENRSRESVDGIMAEVEAMQQRIDTMVSDARAAEVTYATDLQRLRLQSQIQKAMERNTKMSAEQRHALTEMSMELSGDRVTTTRFREIQSALKGVEVQLVKTGKAGRNFFTTFTQGLEKFGGWSIVTKTLTAVYRVLGDVYRAVVDLDSAMTELRRVTDLTDQGYRNFRKTAAKMANTVGASVSDTINATADFARLGYSVEEASQLAQAALTYKNIGDGIEDIGTATESVISTLAAFNDELTAGDAMYIVDMFNEVGNKFAISSVGIGDALQRSASALAAAGNTVQESIGMITAMNEIVQDPDSVGTAVKTLTMYLRATKTAAEDAGISTDGMAASVSELRDELLALTGQRVDIQLDEDTYKSTFQIIRELSAVWDELTDKSKSNVLNLIGGKRNANIFSALIENFAQAEKAATTAYDALGSATTENAQYLDSIAGKLTQLQGHFEDFAQSILDSEVVKVFVDLLDIITQIGTWLADNGLFFPLVGVAGAVTDAVRQFSALHKKVESFADLYHKNLGADGVLDVAQTGAAMAESISDYNSAMRESYVNMLLSQTQFQMLDANMQDTILKAAGLGAEYEKTATKAKGFFGQLEKGWRSLSGLGKASIIFTAITTAISLVTGYIEKMRRESEEALQKTSELVETYTSQTKTHQDHIKTLKGLEKEYTSLSAGVKENGERASLTGTQYERYLAIVKQVAELSPDLVTGYNEQGEAIALMSGAIQQAIQDQEEMIQNQRTILLASGQTIFDDNKTNYKTYVRDIETAFGNIVTGISVNIPDENVETLETLRVELQSLYGIFDGDSASWSLDGLEKIYQDSANFLKLIRDSNVFDASALAVIDSGMYAFKKAYVALHQFQEKQIEFLMADLMEQDWFGDIPMNAADEIEQMLYGVLDSTKSYTDNIAEARSVTEEFLSGMGYTYLNGQTMNDYLSDMARQVKNGTVSVEEYTSDMEAFLSMWQETDIVSDQAVSAIRAYYLSLVQVDQATQSVTEGTAAFAQSIETLTEAVDGWKEYAEVLKAAQEDMALLGHLSAETIDAIAGILEPGENILDYLKLEHGQLLLNEEALRSRQQAMSDTNLNGLKAEAEYLRKIIQQAHSLPAQLDMRRGWFLKQDGDTELPYPSNFVLPEGYADLDEVIARYQLLQQTIAGIEALGKTDVDAFDLGMSDLQEQLGEVTDVAANVYELYEKVRKGTKLTNDEIYSLMTSAPDLAATLAGADTIEAQSAALDAAWAEYQKQWTEIIQGRLDILKTTLSSMSPEDEEYDTMAAVIGGLESMLLLDLSSVVKEVEQTNEAFGTLSDTLGALENAKEFRQSLTDKSADVMDQIAKAQEMAEQLNQVPQYANQQLDWRYFAQQASLAAGAMDQIEWDETKLRAYTDAMVDLYLSTNNITGLTPEFIKNMKDWAYQTAQAEKVTLSLGDALDSISKAQDFRAAGAKLSTDPLDMLKQAQAMADDLNKIGHAGRTDWSWMDFASNLRDAASIADIEWNSAYVDAYADAILGVYVDTEKLATANPAVLEQLREMARTATEAAASMDALSDALSLTDKAASLWTNVQKDLDNGDYLSLDTASALIDLFGENWGQVMEATEHGFRIKVGVDLDDELLKLIGGQATDDDLIKMTGDAEGFVAALKAVYEAQQKAYTEEVSTENAEAAAQQIEDAHEKVREKINEVASAYQILQQAQEDVAANGTIGAETLQSFMDTFGTDWYKYLKFDGDKILPNEAELESAFNDRINAIDLTGFGDQAENVRAVIRTMFQVDENQTAKLEDAFGMVSNAADLVAEVQSEIASSGKNSLGTLQSVINLMGDGWQDAVTFTEDGFVIQEDAITAYVNQAIDALEVEEKLKKQMKDSVKVGMEKASAYDMLAKAISNVGTASSLLTNIQSGEGDALSMIEQAAKMAEEGGGKISDFVNVVSGQLVWSEEAITQWATKSVDALEQYAEVTPEMREYLISLAKAEIEAATAAEAMAKAHTRAKTAISNMPQMGDNVELTYEAYQELIEADKRYSAAVQYQNGILTLNRDAYAGVTQAILNETKAMAQQKMEAALVEKANLLMLASIGKLDDAGKQRLQDLNAEIMGYQVLVSELNNATGAYQRFLNASSDSNSGRYAASKDAMKVIQDTLYNKKSAIFGMIGREQYTAALDLLIDPKIEVGTSAFKTAWQTVQRYMQDGAKGATAFYDDLVKNGFIDANGNLDASMQEMASSLGVSMEFLRTMFDELNQYQSEENKIKITAESDVETEAKSAKETLAELEEQVLQFNTTLDVAHEITIGTSAAITALGKVSSALSDMYNKIKSINGSKITVDATVNTQQGSSNGGGSSSGGSSGVLSGLLGWLTGKSGTASASGTRRAAGGRTLVGELGPETVVDPHTNTWYTVGNRGAEFVNLPKDAIVFNAAQTQDLFKNGGVQSRGQAMAAGNAPDFGDYDKGAKVAKSLGETIGNLFTSGLNALKNAVNGVEKLADQAAKLPKSDYATGTGAQRPGGTGGSSGSGSGKSKADQLKELSEAYEKANEYLEHLIRHQEHLYEVAQNGLEFPAMEASLTEQARIYRKMMSEAQAMIQQMIAAGADDTTEELQEVEEAYWSAYSSLYDVIDQLNHLYVDALNNKIDGIQQGYDNFASIMDEISESGKVSVDMFQQLLDHGVQYLNYLELIDGQYVVNTEALEEMLATEKEQLAIEQALAYVSQIRQALTDDDPQKVAQLVNLTNEISNNTWDLVYANAALLKTMGLTEEQYKDILHNIDMMKDLSDRVNTSLVDTTDAYKEQEDALDRILEFTEQLIKYETEEKIEAIEDEIEAYQKLIDMRKEALQTAKEDAEYSQEVADRTKEIASMEARIAQLSLDDSREARAERAKLEEELAKLQSDLAGVQGDRAHDLQMDALDKQSENFQTEKQGEIERLQSTISSAEKLYQAALQRIDTGWQTLYHDLIAWNTEAGNALNSEITNNWDLALQAARRYGSYVDAVIARTGNPMTGYTMRVGGMPMYHDGGVVTAGGLKHNEVVAVLEEGEEVLTKQQRTGLYRIVDFAKELSDRLGTAIGRITLPFSNFTPALAGVGGMSGAVVSTQQSISFAPAIEVNISHSGAMTDTEARAFGRQVGGIAMEQMQQAFERRGYNNIFSPSLKQ